MSTPKYRVGDKVVIVSKKTKDMRYYEWMTRYFCTVMTIREIVSDSEFPYKMEEDFDDPIRPFGWDWSDNMIDHEATAALNNKEEKTMENKTAKLIIDGKEFEVTLPDSVIAELTKPKKVTGFERADYNESYYMEECGNVLCYTDHYVGTSVKYNVANYYTDKALAEWCCRADTLNRKMRRWAAEHNTNPINWGGETVERYIITYNYKVDELAIRCFNHNLHLSQVYFSSKEIAESAIAEFGDEIKWLAINRPKWF